MELEVDPFCNPNNPKYVPIEDIQEARNTLGQSCVYTPCLKSHLSRHTKTNLFLKKEFLQYTGSFKERGARNFMMKMPDEKKRIGVIGASAGNHAQGMAYHGGLLGIPVTVVMPVTAPIMKIQKCKMFKANVVLFGNNLAESKAHAFELAKEKGLVYLNGYDHPDVLAGAGTIGLEILEQVPDVDAVIIPCGGGGLLAGVSSAIKSLKPNTTIIGVESEACSGLVTSLEGGKVTTTTCTQSLADGLAVATIGYNAFETIQKHLDRAVVVKEDMIAVAILALVELEKCIVEGAGAVPIAALLSGSLMDLQNKTVVAILSGGNIDSTLLGRVMERGLAVLGRLLRFSVMLKEKGGLTILLNKLTELGICIKEIIHERAWVINDIFSVQVTIVCETTGMDHAIELKTMLDAEYTDVDYSYFPNVCAAKSIGI